MPIYAGYSRLRTRFCARPKRFGPPRTDPERNRRIFTILRKLWNFSLWMLIYITEHDPGTVMFRSLSLVPPLAPGQILDRAPFLCKPKAIRIGRVSGKGE